MKQLKLAIVGMGKIARDQHLPAIAANSGFQLAAIASPDHRLDSVPSFTTLEILLREIPDIDAVIICTPPQVRYDLAWHALNHRKHVMLEKPPGATLGEMQSLVDLAERQDVALFAAWHSREAPGVEAARGWLSSRHIRKARVIWKENVRISHPGQTWIWKAGGLGVFDSGINALSILTHITPGAVVLRDATLSFPSNCETPIAAELLLNDQRGAPIRVELDFLHPGPPAREIVVETDVGRMLLADGGSIMHIDGNSIIEAANREYPRLYTRFQTLIDEHRIDVDTVPLRLVGDAFLLGSRLTVQPFLL